MKWLRIINIKGCRISIEYTLVRTPGGTQSSLASGIDRVLRTLRIHESATGRWRRHAVRKQMRRDRGMIEHRREKVRKKLGVFPAPCENVRATDYHATVNGRTKPIETRDKQIRRSCIERHVAPASLRTPCTC